MLQVKHIYKEYKTGNLVQKALDDVSLNLRDNEFVAILGPSGSGKTTLLNIIGGLDRYDHGDLIINGISTKKYKDRDWDSYRNHTIGFVFQSYNLIPHQTILANVELALTISGIGKAERKERAKKALEQVGLGEQLHKKPNQMSGGQMQRVAIARALVNDPDILLADEPTGALDSETSIQVMELLREVAKDRLVVMVTHNPELADEYATRIVKLKDGKIRSDSDAYVVDEENLAAPEHKNMGKASMSFLTALSLSFNNLKTKKARTLLTSFAGSIGIIGIALILSLSTGVNQYIQSVEEETLSEYPLQIQSTGFDLTSMMNVGVSTSSENEEKTDEDHIKVSQMVTNMFSTMDTNDLASLKKYLESGESDIEKYTNAIEYSYSVTPQIYRKDGDDIRQVHPDKSLAALGISSENSTNNMISSMMSTNMFYEMPENPDLYEKNYDIKAGRWPENYNECVVVLSPQGGVSDFLLYMLGLRDSKELDEMVKQFLNEEDVVAPVDTQDYQSEDFLGITFKLVDSADYYEYDSEYKVWKDKTDNADYMKQLVENGEEIRVVGVVQASEDAKGANLMMGIAYPTSLTQHVVNQAKESEIVKQQIATPTIDVFTNEKFGADEEKEPFDMQSLFTIDEEALKDAFVFDQSKITVGDFSSMDFGNVFQDSFENIDLSQIEVTMPELEMPSFEQIFEGMDFTISQETMENLSQQIFEGFQEYLLANEYTDPTKMGEYFAEYMSTEEVQNLLKENLMTPADFEEIEAKIAAYMETYMQSYATQVVTQYSTAITNAMQETMAESAKQMSSQIQSQIEQTMSQTMAQMGNAISINPEAFANAFEMNMTEEDLKELLMSMGMSDNATYDGNLKKLNYVDFEDPDGIDIYPIDFAAKEKVIEILDGYNEKMEAEGKEEQVISYTDMVGTLMSSVTDIIDTISYVLIAFVAISLIVSSIMIGVITYISVLERKKEIGILRAIGASKGNISQVFNAETFIIGLFAGVLGIGITLLILIPANMAIHYIAGNNDVSAVLPVIPAIVLIALSILLTLIGGLIPSKTAAKSDPVTALRTE